MSPSMEVLLLLVMSPTILCDVVVVLDDDSDVVVAYLYTYSVPDNFTFFLSI